MLPIGQVTNYADRVALHFFRSLLDMAAAGKHPIPAASPAPSSTNVELIDDAGLKREAAAQVWLWDADKRELHKEKERTAAEEQK